MGRRVVVLCLSKSACDSEREAALEPLRDSRFSHDSGQLDSEVIIRMNHSDNHHPNRLL